MPKKSPRNKKSIKEHPRVLDTFITRWEKKLLLWLVPAFQMGYARYFDSSGTNWIIHHIYWLCLNQIRSRIHLVGIPWFYH